MTAVEYLLSNLPERFKNAMLNSCEDLIEQAKQEERKQRAKDYNAGYQDAQCNHINDAENYISDSEYIQQETTRKEVSRERVLKEYMRRVDQIAEDCDWVTQIGPETLVNLVIDIIEETY